MVVFIWLGADQLQPIHRCITTEQRAGEPCEKASYKDDILRAINVILGRAFASKFLKGEQNGARGQRRYRHLVNCNVQLHKQCAVSCR